MCGCSKRNKTEKSSILRTSYRGNSSGNDAVYPYFLVPEKNTPVYPLRRCDERKAYGAAALLATALTEHLSPHGFEAADNVCLKFAEGGRCYFTDIAIIARDDEANLRIDIEIDEPYDLCDFAPRHYLENRQDSQRDRLFIQAGWTVVRIAEKQAATETDNCVAFISNLINTLTGSGKIPLSPNIRTQPLPIRKWTRITAENLAAKGYRESYLKHSECRGNDILSQYDNRPLSEEEILYASFLPTTESCTFESKERHSDYNTEHCHPRDRHIKFFPETHTYLYKGRDVLKSVTTVISEYFATFDMRAAADKKALQTGRSAQSFVDEWSYTGKKASETGSFMHQQFENTFLGIPVENNFNFSYTSPTFSRSERIDISKEIGMFNAFLRKNDIRPYRTEWNIYDAEKGIAGSPDLIATYKDKRLMFDWKRSSTLIRLAGNSFAINDDCWGKHGFGALSRLRDNAFSHYSLQQGIYKHILEKHYGLQLDGMFLVVIHPDYNRYFCIQVPDVSSCVEHIMSRL